MRLESSNLDLGIYIYKLYMTDDEINQIKEKAFDFWRKEANIPGYRKGTAPKELIYSKYASEIDKTFREILTDKIEQSIKSNHNYGVDSISIIDSFVNHNESKIEIPGERSKHEHVFVVKVSSITSLYIKDEEKLKNELNNITFTEYSLNKDTIDTQELAKLFFADKRNVDNIDLSKKDKYIIKLSIEVNDKIGIDISLHLGKYPKLADEIKSIKLFEPFELSLSKELKEVIQNYMQDINIPSNVENKVQALVSKITIIEDDEIKVQENINEFSKLYGRDQSIVSDILNNEIINYNINRLITISINKVIENSEVHIGEEEFLRKVLTTISSTLSNLRTPYHISLTRIDYNYYPQAILRSMIVDEAFKKLYYFLFGTELVSKDSRETSKYKVYNKLLEITKSQKKEISYKQIKEEMPYLLFDFIT
ncbi:MAG: trigger factor family protein [Brevinematales bacterium]|nr:trigger factor family protein [Brevinematales bacterium]